MKIPTDLSSSTLIVIFDIQLKYIIVPCLKEKDTMQEAITQATSFSYA